MGSSGPYPFQPSGGRPDAFAGALGGGAVALARVDLDPSSLGPVPSPDPMVVSRYSPDGAELAELYRSSGLLRWRSDTGSGVHPFTTRFLRIWHDGWLVFGDGGSPRYEMLDPETGERRVVQWSAAQTVAGAVEWAQLEQSLAASSEVIDQFRMRSLGAMHRDQQLPIYAALIADVEGNIWVKNYEPAADNSWTGSQPWGPGGTWRVFNSLGSELGSVAVPDDLIPLQIGVDFVVGLRKDSLGVEYVRGHALHRTSGQS